jgi:hypothetical protein
MQETFCVSDLVESVFMDNKQGRRRLGIGYLFRELLSTKRTLQAPRHRLDNPLIEGQ